MRTAIDPRNPSRRRCDECGRVFLAKVNHTRPHAFCSEPHRRAYDHAHRKPAAQAAYMRRYRAERRDPTEVARRERLRNQKHLRLKQVVSRFRLVRGRAPSAAEVGKELGISRQAATKRIKSLVTSGELGQSNLPGQRRVRQAPPSAAMLDLFMELPSWADRVGPAAKAALRIGLNCYRRTGRQMGISELARRLGKSEASVAQVDRRLAARGIWLFGGKGPGFSEDDD